MLGVWNILVNPGFRRKQCSLVIFGKSDLAVFYIHWTLNTSIRYLCTPDFLLKWMGAWFYSQCIKNVFFFFIFFYSEVFCMDYRIHKNVKIVWFFYGIKKIYIDDHVGLVVLKCFFCYGLHFNFFWPILL